VSEVLGGLIGFVVGAVAGAILRPHMVSLSEWSRLRRQHGIRIHVERDPRIWLSYIGHPLPYPTSFLFWDANALEEPPNSLEGLWAWAREKGGEDVFITSFVVTLQATNDLSVVVDPPRIANHEREAVREGVICSPEGLGGNGPPPHRFHINLDADPATVTFAPSRDESSAGSPSFKMKRDDTDRIEIVAWAEHQPQRHRWSLTIPLLVNGERVELPVDDDGRSFVTVGKEARPILFWEPFRRRWVAPEEFPVEPVEDDGV
jgi:hypothetical protein